MWPHNKIEKNGSKRLSDSPELKQLNVDLAPSLEARDGAFILRDLQVLDLRTLSCEQMSNLDTLDKLCLEIGGDAGLLGLDISI